MHFDRCSIIKKINNSAINKKISIVMMMVIIIFLFIISDFNSKLELVWSTVWDISH